MEVKTVNLFYYNTISHIGGIETWLWEIAKKYGSTHSIAVVYSYADKEQLARLKPLVRTIQHQHGMKYKAERAFFCYDMDIIDEVEAKEKVFVVHGNYKLLSSKPPVHPSITKVIAVSKESAESYTELTGIPCEVAYNPLTVDKPKRMIHIVSATRLDGIRGTDIKGGSRMAALADALDKYCETHKATYRWDIFCNIEGQDERSEHIFYHQGRLDIRDYLADADYVCQLSDTEACSYTINEALTLGTPVIVTPLGMCKELGINDKMAVFVDFDLANVDKAVKKIFTTKKWEFSYKAPEDRWDELLAGGGDGFKYDPNAIVKVRALRGFTDIVDTEVGRPRELGEEFEVTVKRFEQLEDFGGLIEKI